MKKTILFILFISIIFSVFTTIINVPSDQPTIQEGIDIAVNGDTVLVQTGIYYENIEWSSLNGITLQGISTESTIIDGNQQGNVIYMWNNQIDTLTVIRNLTLTNGLAQYGEPIHRKNGGGICCIEGSPKLIDLNIYNNSTIMNYRGGGIYCFDSDMIISSVKITNNSSDFGGGIFCYDSDIILRDIFIQNNNAIISAGGIYCWQSNPTLHNVIISDNIGGWGGGIHFTEDCNAIIINSTICSNGCYAIYCNNNSNVQLVNSILWNNELNSILFHYSNAPNFTSISYSDIEGGVTGIETNDNGEVIWLEGNIDSNPLFIDAENGDYHLTDDSPCIDAGDPNTPLDPDGTITDMGAFYYNQALSANFSANPISGYAPLTVNFTDESFGNIINWKWYFFDGDSSFVQNPTHIYQMAGTYDISLTVTDENDSTDTEIKTDYITVFVVPPAPPTNVQIEISGNDVILNWAEVDTTIFGSPIDVDYYIIENSNYPYNDFIPLGATPDTMYTHYFITPLSDKMFYQIKSFVGTRQELDEYVERYGKKPEDNYLIEW